MAEILIDAAVNGADGSGVAFFFLADHFVAYDWNTDRVKDGVRPVSEWNFPTSFSPNQLVGPLSAGLKGRNAFTIKAYFFKERSYTRFNLATNVMETSIPKSITAWHFPANFLGAPDGAFNGRFSREKKAYFFKGKQYLRYDWDADQVDAGYPKLISNMINIPLNLASGVDAAVDGDGRFAGFGYLFKGNTYLRFNWNDAGGEPFGDGPSALIQGNWNGLLELLMAGKAIAEATTWIQITVQQLRNYSAALSIGSVFPDQAPMNAALGAHFHVAPTLAATEKISIIAQIVAAYTNIINTFNQSATQFRYRIDSEAIADGNPSIDAAYTFFNGTMNFTRNFATKGPHTRAAIVIHEAVHRFDNLSGSRDTHISEWYVTDASAAALGLPVVGDMSSVFSTRYDLMNTANSLHNPSSFAAFAQHVFNRSDTRFGFGHGNL